MAKEKEDDWSPVGTEGLSADDHLSAASQAVHFSFKYTNSNARAGGIRVSKSKALKLPHLSVRTVIAKRILPVDYTKSVTKYTGPDGSPISRAYKQVNRIISAPEAIPEKIAPSLISRIRSIVSEDDFSDCGDSINFRMKQLLLPRSTNDYLSVTPLMSSGLSAEFNARLGMVRRMSKEHGESIRRVYSGDFPIGGANPVNVGSAGMLLQGLRRPAVFFAPSAPFNKTED